VDKKQTEETKIYFAYEEKGKTRYIQRGNIKVPTTDIRIEKGASLLREHRKNRPSIVSG